MISKSMLVQSQKRWREVAEVQAQEEQEMSIRQRWQKLNALFRMAVELELPRYAANADEDLAWEHWNKLRNLYLAQS